ncbi:uncharacterized protein LOC123891980 [Trifolium pratense]|uniref:uncharacterized protein LOC123891980 n=1 Tax=Trifolium pratense TaxID=57577 RepID=UPI001E696EB1|nr:uncharacterized protein LOC123891980 [Trifolium pratense]
MEGYCQQLKLNIDDTPVQYFLCECSKSKSRETKECLLSIFRNKNCSCRKAFDRKLLSPEYLNLENGFVKENATFIISDDLYVMPNVFGASLLLLQKLEVDTLDAIEEKTVDINKKEVVDLLKLSLLSKAPLSDFVLKIQSIDNFNIRSNLDFLIGELPSDEGRKMSVKVTLRKSNEQILFVEAEDDFVDFVFSFLTFPLGGVLHMLQGFTSLRCIDNLYKSMTELSSERYLFSTRIKDKLSKPQCFPQFELNDQILPIGSSSLPNYFFVTYINDIAYSTDLTKEMLDCKYNPKMEHIFPDYVPYKFVDLKSSTEKSTFAKGPLIYMVTDDLCVTPMSSISTMSYLRRAKVPLSDLEERVIKIGVKEGLSILKASLISTSALQYGLKQFIRTIKVEK